jgi:hypothetical protein
MKDGIKKTYAKWTRRPLNRTCKWCVESEDEDLSDAEDFDEKELPTLDDEKQAINNQLATFLQDDNLLPYFHKFVTKLGRKQALHQHWTSGTIIHIHSRWFKLMKF